MLLSEDFRNYVFWIRDSEQTVNAEIAEVKEFRTYEGSLVIQEGSLGHEN